MSVVSKYVVDDSRKLNKIFDEKKISKPKVIITSPPYYNIKNYENNLAQLGQKQSYVKFLEELSDIFQQCYKISSNSSVLWVIVDTIRTNGKTLPLPFDLVSKLEEKFKDKTWILRDILIWNKPKNIPWHTRGRFKNEFEYILLFSKTNKYLFNIDKVREIVDYKKWWKSYPERYNGNGKPPSNIWEFNPPIRGWGNGYQNHLCPFPFPLIERMISLSSKKGDWVFDPFAGSGSVIALAKEMGRNGIGIDINKRYKELFMKEVRIGAKKYWEQRTVELKQQKRKITDFSQKNSKLRKLKSASFINNELGLNSKSSRAVLIEKNRETTLYLVRNNKAKVTESKILANLTSEANKSFKSNINLKEINKSSFLKSLNGTKVLYAYDTNKFYNLLDTIEPKDLFQNPDADIVLSNIRIEV